MLDGILQQQSSWGGFPSFVDVGGEIIEDENCFITSLVLLELLESIRTDGDSAEVWNTIEKGVKFIESCEQPDRKGCFYFYPQRSGSPRLAIAIDADYDDSALALTVLLRSGKRSLKEIQETIIELFEPGRITQPAGQDAAWVKTSLFRTWVTRRATDNPADCCVNLNILTLYAAAEMLDHHDNTNIMSHIEQAVTMYGTSVSAMRRIAPYYAHPAELFFCIERIARYNVQGAEGLLQKVHQSICREFGDSAFIKADRPVCCNAHGRPLWFAPVLQQTRKKPSQMNN